MQTAHVVSPAREYNGLPVTATAISIAHPRRLYHWLAHFSLSLKKIESAIVTAAHAMRIAPTTYAGSYSRIKYRMANWPIKVLTTAAVVLYAWVSYYPYLDNAYSQCHTVYVLFDKE